MWKSDSDLKGILKNISEIDVLEKLYSLSILWKNAIYSEGYLADKIWPDLLKLSAEGEALVSVLDECDSADEYPDFYLALFGKFSHHDLIFDVRSANVNGIVELLQKEMFSGKIRFPYRFGRELYDRYHDMQQGDRAEHLLPVDVRRLLDGTPMGVYQVGCFIVGPLGVVECSEARAIHPTLSLPLWHCADTGCKSVHHVKLVPEKTTLDRIFRNISRQALDKLGPPSNWAYQLKWLHRKGRWEGGRKYSDIVELIANCIVGKERVALLIHCLMNSSKNSLRQTLGNVSGRRSHSEGSPQDVASRLSQEEQLQLLMTLGDGLLIDSIDIVMSEKKIKISLGDSRLPEFSAGGRSTDSPCELSSLGVRAYTPNAILNLSALVWNAYESSGLLNELEWRLRNNNGKKSRESLLNYIRLVGPDATIRDLALSSSPVTRKICAEINLGLEHVSSNDDTAVNKMLWKLGFNPAGYSDTLKRLKSRLSDFNEKLLSIPSVDTEDDREAIRAVGVNLFVSLEDFLDTLISYNVWLLSEDHFASGRFYYDIDVARKSVANILGVSLGSDGVITTWSAKGGNALGALLRYLNQAASWIGSLEDQDRDQLRQEVDDLPHFYDDKLRPFPFKHTQLWADVDVTELGKYKDGFLTISKLVQQADLASIRNGIDHHRDEYTFPDSNKMLACVARLQQAIESADVNRYFPKTFWLMESKSNRYGAIELIYEDYALRQLTVFGPRVAAGLPARIYESPVIIAPNNLLGYPNSQLMFWLRERSEYSKYWEDYPRRWKSESTVSGEVGGGVEVMEPGQVSG